MAAKFSKQLPGPVKVKDRPNRPDWVSEFEQYYNRQYANSTETSTVRNDGAPRYLELHPSSYPYCPVQHAYDIALNPPSDTMEMPATMAYYVQIGTAFHSMIQKHLGYGGNMVGVYTCPNCNYVNELTDNPICPECSTKMTYDELDVKIGKRTRGHVDGVFRLRNGKYIVIDYKTSSTSVIENYNKTGKGLPYHHSTYQIRSYCYYLTKLYGLDIVGWALVYVARDNPQTSYAVCGQDLKEGELDELRGMLKSWDNSFDKVVRASTYKDIIPLIEIKPCKDKKFYETEYHSDYHPCPLVDVCFDESLLRKTLKQAFEQATHLPLTDKSLP